MADLSVSTNLLTAEQLGLFPFERVFGPATLTELFKAHGLITSQVAFQLGLSIQLLQQVVARRQPLPRRIALLLAGFLGESLGTVQACAGLNTDLRGPRVETPLPPDPLTEPFPAFQLAETAPPPFPSGGIPEIVVWTCGANLAPNGADSGVLRVGRNTGLIHTRTALASLHAPAALATDGTTVFTAGTTGSPEDVALLNGQTGDAIVQTGDLHYVQPLGVVWESSSGTLWLCSTGLTTLGLVQVHPENGLAAASLTLSDGVNDFFPRDAVSFNGLLYVTGFRHTGIGAGQEGRVFEVDPVAVAVLRTSTGADLGSAYSLAVDSDAGLLLATSVNVGGGPGPQLTKVVVSSMVASALTLSGDPETLGSPTWVTRAFGSWWVTDLTVLHGQRLFSVSSAGAVLQSRNFGSTVPGGHSAADPWFLWYADPGGGRLHVLDPNDIGTSPTTIATGGKPNGLLVTSG